MVGASFNGFTRRSNMCTQTVEGRPTYIYDGHPHSFRVFTAFQYGMVAAVLHMRIREELEYNSARKINIDEEGFAWVDSTLEQMQRGMPYATLAEIRDALQTLTEAGLVIFKPEPSSRPHAAWYSLPKDQWRAR
jgi:hypothetical protein